MTNPIWAVVVRVAVVATVAATFALPATAPAGAATESRPLCHDNWRQFGGGASHRGLNRCEQVLGRSNVNNLTTAWAVPGNVVGNAAVVGDWVFSSSTDEHGQPVLRAVERATGAPIWEVSGLFGYPSVADGLVLAVDFESDMLTAHRADTGRLAWSVPVDESSLGYGPTVTGHVAYWGNYIRGLEAVWIPTGAVLWQGREPRHCGGLYAAPTVGGGRIYQTTTSGCLYASVASTGKILWKIHPAKKSDLFSNSPALVNGILYAGSYRSTLFAIRAESGAVLWRTRLAPVATLTATPAVAYGTVYVGAELDGGDEGQVYAVRASDGRVVWTRGTAGSPGGSPTVANGVVYVGQVGSFSRSGQIVGYRSDDGKVLWAKDLAQYVTASPVVVGSRVYIGTWTDPENDGFLSAFGLSGG